MYSSTRTHIVVHHQALNHHQLNLAHHQNPINQDGHLEDQVKPGRRLTQLEEQGKPRKVQAMHLGGVGLLGEQVK
jgi:hypothetical protein